MIEIKDSNDPQFPIAIEINSGTSFWTKDAAIELYKKLGEKLKMSPEDEAERSHIFVLDEVGELLPCPFCGCDIIINYRNGDLHYYYCDYCGASTNRFSVSTGEEKVRLFWNKRANFV